MSTDRKLRRANANLKKTGISNDKFNALLDYAYNNDRLNSLGRTYWNNNTQAAGAGVSRVRDLIDDYNHSNPGNEIKLNYSQKKDLTDAFRKYSGVYGDLGKWYGENFSDSQTEDSTGTSSQPTASSSTGTSSANSSTGTSSANSSTGTWLSPEMSRLLQEASNEISDEYKRTFKDDIINANKEINESLASRDRYNRLKLNSELNKNTLPEVKKITPGMDNLLALDRKGRRSLRRGEYTKLNNGTAVQAKTRKEGRQLARAVNRQRRANNRTDRRQGNGTLDSFLAGYARKGGKLTLMDIYMNNK